MLMEEIKMKQFVGIILAIFGTFIIIITVAVIFRFLGLIIESYFLPKEQTVQRNAFEQTKSYVHGAIQDIAKYYEEYNKAKNEIDRKVIANIIKQRFAEFDANNIHSSQLREWFIKVRGY